MFAEAVTHPYVAIVALLASIALTALCAGAAIFYETQRARLNPATRFVDLQARLQLRREELHRIEEEIRAKQQAGDDRDRILAEVSALQARLEAVTLEYAGLEEARRQIEAVKRDAADAASLIAEKNGELERKLAELKNIETSAQNLKAEIETAQTRLDKLLTSHQQKVEQLETQKRQLEGETETMARKRDEVQDELNRLRGERSFLLTVVAETASLSADIERLRDERTKAAEAASRAEEDRRNVEATTQEIRRRLDAVEQELAKAILSKDDAQRQAEAALAKSGKVESSIRTLEAQKAALEEFIRKHDSSVSSFVTAEVLNDLKQVPAPLLSAARSRLEDKHEIDALNGVMQHLDKLKLKYSRRTVLAFHTALKINDYSQLTVLSGVSGTGKSLLPRRYAQAMGIHFLSIAVEPRWDSPQDLLGFYNYIEKRYRATDLARALVHMDPFNTSGLSEKTFDDHMMLVLLDEMNLARVEYYFSEFLSRLEARPAYKDSTNPIMRQDAEIPVDIRGRAEGPLKLFPSHNVLFVGTMNDDESTQALSDKVLDRSNIFQFAKPDRFQTDMTSSSAEPKAGYLSFGRWRDWLKVINSLRAPDQDWISNQILSLSNIMEECGRPFGHRLNTAIFAYCANYPSEDRQGEGVRKALADQIEFRILPKLRGVQIDDHADQFEKLRDLIARELGDDAFAERLTRWVDKQRTTGGLFNWRGYTRET